MKHEVKRKARAYLRRRPRASSSATAPVRLPASSSWTVSQERVYVASQAYPCCVVVPMRRQFEGEQGAKKWQVSARPWPFACPFRWRVRQIFPLPYVHAP